MTKEEVFQNAIRSVELDPSSAYAHRTAAFAYYFDRQLDSFRKEARIAFDLAPYNPEIFAQLAFLIGVTGEWDRAVKLATKAYSLNPVTAGGWYHSTLFYYHYTNRRFQDALDIMKQHTNPSLCENQMKFIIAYAQLGQSELSRPHYEACQKAVPDFSSEWMAGTFRMWNFREQDIALFMDGFAKAGYPCKRPDCSAAP